MFSFHGGGGDIDGQIFADNMSAIADTAGFIIVYPQARPDPNDGKQYCFTLRKCTKYLNL